MAIAMAQMCKLKFMCCRQFQNRIEESVYSLLKIQIERFGLMDDFIILNKRFSHSEDGSKNRHYYCNSQRILAPGKGRVVEVMSHIFENTPKQQGKTPGNYIIIDHENGEYSFLAHLKRGTIMVQVGERVQSGQLLGLCGNSGHSSEPHLHYHLQNTPIWYRGEGLPAQFARYRMNGKRVIRGEPVLDDFVEHLE